MNKIFSQKKKKVCDWISGRQRFHHHRHGHGAAVGRPLSGHHRLQQQSGF